MQLKILILGLLLINLSVFAGCPKDMDQAGNVYSDGHKLKLGQPCPFHAGKRVLSIQISDGAVLHAHDNTSSRLFDGVKPIGYLR